MNENILKTYDLIQIFHQTKRNKNINISQTSLDLGSNRNTNPFNYRGQFSPDLVKYLLEIYSKNGDSVLDPFVGCGTLIYVALNHNLNVFGSEINPFAVYMARLSNWALVKHEIRNETLIKIRGEIVRFKSDYFGLVNYAKSLDDGYEKDFVLNLLMNLKPEKTNEGTFSKELDKLENFVLSLPYSTQEVEVFHRDARDLPLSKNSIDLVITSPPYINVFNYHQNGRALMEELNWNILNIAKSEFGSNRKNRQNRFLTVIQYMLDISETLMYLSTLTKSDSRIIFVVGKETSVRKTTFYNGEIIGVLGQVIGLGLEDVHTRKFKNMFGKQIVEEIIVFRNQSISHYNLEEIHDVAEYYIRNKLKESTEESIIIDLKKALNDCKKVKSSPIYKFN